MDPLTNVIVGVLGVQVPKNCRVPLISKKVICTIYTEISQCGSFVSVSKLLAGGPAAEPPVRAYRNQAVCPVLHVDVIIRIVPNISSLG